MLYWYGARPPVTFTTIEAPLASKQRSDAGAIVAVGGVGVVRLKFEVTVQLLASLTVNV